MKPSQSRTGPVINQSCAVVGQGPMGLVWTNTLRRLGARQVIAIDRVPFERAVEAFEAYADPAGHEGWLKSVLVM